MIPKKALYKLIKEFVPDFIETYNSKFETRLKVQKIVYLFEQMNDGKDTYGYTWYLAGPYSTILTNQIYNEVLESPKTSTEQWNRLTFTKPIQDLINKLQKLISEAKKINQNNLKDSQIFELIASIWYISKIIDSDDYKDQDERTCLIKEKLLLNKKHFKLTEGLDQIIDLVLIYRKN